MDGNGKRNADKNDSICICENQKQADEKLPEFIRLSGPCKRILAMPLKEELHIEPYLAGGKIEAVFCGGETAETGSLCCFEWILCLRRQCVQHGVAFYFVTTGTNFQKGCKQYHLDPAIQKEQARKAGIDYVPGKEKAGEKARGLEEDPMEDLFARLSRSKFRSKFRLSQADAEYAESKGSAVIRRHAQDFVKNRLAPSEIPNDGRQTPMRGHPVFVAQHATGTCCRGCLSKWHGIEPGHELTQEERDYVADVICQWIRQQMRKWGKTF